jgi:uncharacterized protein with PIN domain/sulfur carrier protein ThiS
MMRVSLRFYEELNDFLPADLRKQTFVKEIQSGVSVKHLIESLGIPHTEVEIILINGQSVGLDATLEEGDRISVYPMFERLDVTPLLRLRGQPLRKPKFIADAHLGKLARYLRLLGFDTLFFNDAGDQRLVSISVEEKRTLLTRDKALLMHRAITHGGYVHALEPRQQLIEIVNRYDLKRQISPFSRCMVCNGPIKVEKKQRIEAELPLHVAQNHDQFWRCTACRNIYWKGSHYRQLLNYVESLSDNDGLGSSN